MGHFSIEDEERYKYTDKEGGKLTTNKKFKDGIRGLGSYILG